MASHAGSAAGITAGQVMTAPVITVGPDATIAHIAETLTSARISAVPVVDGSGTVLGLISELDLLARSGRTAREIMTTAVISVTTDTDIEQVRRILVGSQIRRVPVLSSGRLVGIISRADLVGRMVEWACGVCGETVRGAHPPLVCPKCGGSEDRFTLQEQPPGP
ncbi:CBS domain-containing protein [Microbacterium luticocti]|uniref:CBS domain-containing protein n=1 Tax=Microbacterium luticocti TaxID=451764 RepID=UPI00042A2DA6|nr:CBS domain-containing protein [Microbacterium luticocti]